MVMFRFIFDHFPLYRIYSAVTKEKNPPQTTKMTQSDYNWLKWTKKKLSMAKLDHKQPETTNISKAQN